MIEFPFKKGDRVRTIIRSGKYHNEPPVGYEFWIESVEEGAYIFCMEMGNVNTTNYFSENLELVKSAGAQPKISNNAVEVGIFI